MNPEEKQKPKGGARLEKRGGAAKPGREKKPKPQRTPKQKALRILYIVLTVIAALIVSGFVIVNFLITPPDEGSLATPRPQYTTVVDEEGNEIQVEIPGLAANRKDRFYTFLVVGQDTFGGGNTDTMMLGAYDVTNQTLNVMSLPRDTYVRYNGRTVLLNSVYNRAGAGDDGIEALEEEVGELTGVTPDFYVIVQWEAVGKLVDAIGGVYFDVPRRMYYNDLSQDFKIDLQPGYQLLDGNDAMGLLRWRHNSDDSGHILNSGYATGDLGRIETQQAFMTAVVQKCLQPSVLLSNLTEYINIFLENVVTDLSMGNLAYFAKSAIGQLDMANVQFLTLPNRSAGDAHLLPIGSEIVEVVNESFNPYEEEITLRDLDLVTSTSSSSGGSSGTSRPATSTPSATPAETPVESPTESPVESPVESPAEPPSESPAEPPLETPGTASTPAQGEPPAGESQSPASNTPGAETEPTPPPVEGGTEPATSETTAQEPAQEEPVATTQAPVTDSGYGPGMEPIE